MTPFAAALEQKLGVDIGVHVLIRPRPGGFVFSPEEVDLMEREVDLCVRAGVAGVVIGALNLDRTVDEAATDRLVSTARQIVAQAYQQVQRVNGIHH